MVMCKMKYMMNRIIKISSLALAGVLAVSACRQEFQFEFSQDGPEMTVTCSEAAYMGGKIAFSVDLAEKTYPMSQLTVQLFTDLDVEGAKPTPLEEYVVRTKENGTYDGSIPVPYLQNVRNGNMAMIFSAVDTHLGYIRDTVYVNVARPEYEYLTLKTEDGTEHRMERKAVTSEDRQFADGYWYSCTGSFPADCNAIIVAPEYNEVPEITFGWAGTGIAAGEDDYIKFSNGVAGEYEITFNSCSFAGSPFVVLNVNGIEAETAASDKYAAVVELEQGGEIVVEGWKPGFADWTIDPDFLELTDDAGKFKFLAVDGIYKLTIETANKFIRVEAMKNNTELATLNEDGTGAVWLIGDAGFGKPTMAQGASWNPENGGLCLAQVSPKVYQITLVAGVQLNCDKVNFKLFHQKTWGGEFGSASISTDSDTFYINSEDSDNGNIFLVEGKKLTMGDIWRFTVDLTGYDGKSGGVLKCEVVGKQEIETQTITFAGTELEMTASDQYQGVVTLEKGQAITVTGISDVDSWYIDPDYLSIGASGLVWNVTSGTYKVYANTATKSTRFTRLAADGSDATLADGALWMMGWGIAHPAITENQQIGFTPGSAYCMAEVKPDVFQFTGIAAKKSDNAKNGERFNCAELSCKYFHQNGWGAEKGQLGTVVITDEARNLIFDNGNIELVSGVTLEEGATYVLTIDLSVEGTETIDFRKK